MIVQSPANGFCLIFKKRSDYSLTHSVVQAGNSPFVVQELGFFDRGVQVYQKYNYFLPGEMRLGSLRADFAFKRLGRPIATRVIYETLVDLYLIDDRIVNYGFRPDQTLAYAHVRNQTPSTTSCSHRNTMYPSCHCCLWRSVSLSGVRWQIQPCSTSCTRRV